MDEALRKLIAQTDDPLVLVLLIALLALAATCVVLFRAWCGEIRAHRETIKENIQWTRQNTMMIGEVRRATERFAHLVEKAGESGWRRTR